MVANVLVFEGDNVSAEDKNTEVSINFTHKNTKISKMCLK
jgi:hypothetical protein